MNSEINISPRDSERIERYLLEKMDPNERNIFEAELDSNPELHTELNVQRELIRAVEVGGLKEDLDKIHAKTIQKSSARPSRNNWFAIAAGLAAIIAVSIWAVNHQSANDSLFAQYSTTDPGLPVPMSASANYTFHDAMVDYKAEKYDKAIAKWTALLKEGKNDNPLNYYIGAAYFNQNNYAAALPWFQKELNDSNGTFHAKAQWYELLCQLKLNETEKVLQTVALPDSPYKDRIESIQQDLQK